MSISPQTLCALWFHQIDYKSEGYGMKQHPDHKAIINLPSTVEMATNISIYVKT